jgi:DUF1680 family protein
MESHALHADGIYYVSDNELWVNIFAPSTADWKAAGVRLTMTTEFPEGEGAVLSVDPKAPRAFTVLIRRPAWAGQGFAIKINGTPLAASTVGPAGSYVRIERKWKTGDRIEIAFPMVLRLEPLPDNRERAAILRGPIVLAGDLGPIQARRPRGEAAPQAKPAAAPTRPTSPDLRGPRGRGEDR